MKSSCFHYITYYRGGVPSLSFLLCKLLFMKHYTLILCSLAVLLLTGCSQKEAIKEPIITETLSSSVSVQTWLAQFRESEFFSWTYLGWIYTPIFISGDTLIVSWAFSVSIPKEATNKTYSSQYTPVTKSYYERIWFTNKDNTKAFNLHISKLIRPDTTYPDKDLCLVEYYDGFLSKSEEIKTIQDQDIYIYYATLISSWPDVEPQKIIDTQFCFVHSGMLYKFSASNYNHAYMNQIINSFKFY